MTLLGLDKPTGGNYVTYVLCVDGVIMLLMISCFVVGRTDVISRVD